MNVGIGDIINHHSVCCQRYKGKYTQVCSWLAASRADDCRVCSCCFLRTDGQLRRIGSNKMPSSPRSNHWNWCLWINSHRAEGSTHYSKDPPVEQQSYGKQINYQFINYLPINLAILYRYVSLPQGISSLTPRFHQGSILPALHPVRCSEVSSHPICRKKIWSFSPRGEETNESNMFEIATRRGCRAILLFFPSCSAGDDPQWARFKLPENCWFCLAPRTWKLILKKCIVINILPVGVGCI